MISVELWMWDYMVRKCLLDLIKFIKDNILFYLCFEYLCSFIFVLGFEVNKLKSKISNSYLWLGLFSVQTHVCIINLLNFVMNRIARNKLCLGNRHELTAKNKVAASVAQSVPVLRYSFGVIHCRFKNNRHKTGKIPRLYKMHHSETERPCFPAYKTHRPIRRTLSFSFEIFFKK
jgi:hypothetical protein